MTSLGKEDLLQKVKKHLYTASSDPVFMEFLSKNGPRISKNIPWYIGEYLQKHQLVEKR